MGYAAKKGGYANVVPGGYSSWPAGAAGAASQDVTLGTIASGSQLFAPTVTRLEILDTLAATCVGAWSVSRLLRAAHGSSPIVRIRRDGGSAGEQDFGVDAAGRLDIDAVTAYCTGVNGFVRTVYDQTTNGRDLGHATAANQPKIWDSSTGLVVGGTNTVPAMDFNGTSHRLVRADALGFTGNPAMTMIGNFALDSGVVTDRFLFGFGNLPVPTAGTALLHMVQGASNVPSISFVSESTNFTLGGNPAATTWQTALIARAAGALQSSTGTQYAIDGTFLAGNVSTHAGDTPNLSNDCTSWGDALDAGIILFDGKASTRMVFDSQITDGSDDEGKLFTWFAAE